LRFSRQFAVTHGPQSTRSCRQRVFVMTGVLLVLPPPPLLLLLLMMTTDT
jgi:hypothetical protein